MEIQHKQKVSLTECLGHGRRVKLAPRHIIITLDDLVQISFSLSILFYSQ